MQEDDKKKRYIEIQNKKEELDKLIASYEKDYGLKISYPEPIDPFSYLLRRACYNRS